MKYLALMFLLTLAACNLASNPQIADELTPGPTEADSTACLATATSGTVGLLALPQQGAAQNGTLDAVGEIIGRTGDNAWWQLQQGTRVGWAAAGDLTITGDCRAVPIVDTATATPAPTATPDFARATVNVNSLNVRRGPGTNFSPPIGTLREGDAVDVIGQNPGGTWYKIAFEGGEGWIFAELTNTEGNVASAPVDIGPPTPLPTNTPIPATPTPTVDPSINFVRDGGMEGSYVNRGGADFNFPEAWQALAITSPQNEVWQNVRPVAFPHTSRPEVRSGSRSLNINRNFGTFTIAVYQQVQVPTGANLSASGWAWLHTCDPDPAICNSDPESGARARVGLDPTGGTDPFGGNVVWGGYITPHDSWGNTGVTARAQGGTVTVFLYATQDWPRGLNQLYWDDVTLNAVN